nr:hypothetical protein [Candidatus Njordarchaeota archaeon]
MSRASPKQVSISLEEFKGAVQRLSKVYARIRTLLTAKARYLRLDSPPNHEMTEEIVGKKFQRFSQAMESYLKSRRKMQAELSVFEKSLRDLEKAESVDEISTLMGLTVLTDHREYRHAMIQIVKCYEDQLCPLFPEIAGIMKFAAQANEVGKWATKLFNYDPSTREDDFTRMIIAIRDHDIDRFNKVHDELIRRIEIEERRSSNKKSEPDEE